jgi:PadR family transcriptional regulator PadR
MRRETCHDDHDDKAEEGISHHHGCREGRLCSFLQAQLLLLLAEGASHGYDLLGRLERPEDPGLLYRTLRLLEAAGYVRSKWETEGGGPARRLYTITPEGDEYLETWAANVRQIRDRMERFLAQYEHLIKKDRKEA